MCSLSDEKFIKQVSSVMLYRSQTPQEEHSPGEAVEGQQPDQEEEELLCESDGAVDQPVGQPPPPLSHGVRLNSQVRRDLSGCVGVWDLPGAPSLCCIPGREGAGGTR